MEALLQQIPNAVRAYMQRQLAPWLNRLTGGRLRPAAVTYTSALMHVPIAFLIALQHYVWAAVLLVIFGMLDSLDGALARVQGSSSERGMLLDASTDRMKEVLLWSGVGYALSVSAHPASAAWAVAACGTSITVSYVKAKGEAVVAVAQKNIPHAVLNKMFINGLLTFEIRMAVLVAGLLLNQLAIASAVVAVLAGATSLGRLQRISKQLG